MLPELGITLADGTVWLSIGQGLLFGAVCLLFGVWIARFVGLLDAEAPAGETLGVGLTSGLLVLASWWAAIVSGGRSSFTPVAVGFAVAIGLAAVRRWRPADRLVIDTASADVAVPTSNPRYLAVAVLGGAIFVVVLGLVYSSTLTQSPRGGVQPLEMMDQAYYSILGRDLAETGTETNYSPSGFDNVPGLPAQTWYHWGEAWLASAAIMILGVAPLDARHVIVLPLLVLAAGAMTGTLVRRLTGARSPFAFIFGFLACLFLAPIPLIAGPNFSSWAVGLVFGITLYGLAAAAVLFAMYGLAVFGARQPTWPTAVFAGSAVALIVPAHVVIAVLGAIGLGSVWATRIVRSFVATHRFPVVAPAWQRGFFATGLMLVATVVWGVATGHSVASGSSPGVEAFNTSWTQSVAIIVLGSGAFLIIAIAWFAAHRDSPMEADLYLGTGVLLLVGVLTWGARLSDFNTFHVFFGGIAVFATPAAAVAVWSVATRLRAAGRERLMLVVVIICLIQVEISATRTLTRLSEFGPGTFDPAPVSILAAIRGLPPDAKIAYACHPTEEVSFWDSRLLALDAQTHRRIVPMCFQVEALGTIVGGRGSSGDSTPLFDLAPQHTLYPDPLSAPTPERVNSFLKANGIDYVFVDGFHPNTLAPDGIVISESGSTQLVRVP